MSFDPNTLPPSVRNAFAMGAMAWPLVVQKALGAGITDLDYLASVVFYLHHPERNGRQIQSHETELIKEWKSFRAMIRPFVISGSSPSEPVPKKMIPINSVKFWINAFIPKDVTGYTKPIPGHPGLTMIPGPGINPLSDCYHTDQRGFSNNIRAASRMHSEAKVSFTNSMPVLTTWHNCDQTVECDCEDGGEECRKSGNKDNMRIVMLPSRICSPYALVNLEVKCAAHNPCAPSSNLAGDIDFEGKVIIDRAARRIVCDLKIDAFPAFEAYATINDGVGVMMFQIMPPRGNTVMNLPGYATRSVQIQLEDKNGDGIFETRAVLKTP